MSTPDPRLQYPPGRPAQAVRQLLDALHHLVDGQRAGHQWVSYAEWGVVTAVDTDAHTATLHTAIWEGDVTYGLNPPAVGDWQIGYFPNTGTPWIKTRRSGTQRWIYRKDRGSAILRRYGWPVPARPADWVIETIRTNLPAPPFAWGAATHPTGGGRELVLQEPNVVVPAFLPDGAVYQPLHTRAQAFTHYQAVGDVLGQGGLVQTYSPAPPGVQLTNIAYESYDTVGLHERWQGTTLPGITFQGASPAEGPHYICCLEEPTTHFFGCVEIFNTIYTVSSFVGDDTHNDVENAEVVDRGTLGTCVPAEVYLQPGWYAAAHQDPDGFVTYILRTPSGGCHYNYFFSEPLGLDWGAVTEETVTLSLAGAHFYTSARVGTAPYYVMLEQNAWRRDGHTITAWIVRTIDNLPFPPGPTSLATTLGVSRDGATPSTILLPPMPSTDHFVYEPRLALDPAGQFIVWGTDKPGAVWQWREARNSWVKIVTVDHLPLGLVYCQNPDGQDVLGYTLLENGDFGDLIASTDAGATWVVVPPLPDSTTVDGDIVIA